MCCGDLNLNAEEVSGKYVIIFARYKTLKEYLKIVKSQLILRSHIFLKAGYNIDNASEIPQLLVCSTLLNANLVRC